MADALVRVRFDVPELRLGEQFGKDRACAEKQWRAASRV